MNLVEQGKLLLPAYMLCWQTDISKQVTICTQRLRPPGQSAAPSEIRKIWVCSLQMGIVLPFPRRLRVVHGKSFDYSVEYGKQKTSATALVSSEILQACVL